LERENQVADLRLHVTGFISMLSLHIEWNYL